MEEILLRAARYAAQAHHGQFRRDGVTPYTFHTDDVANILAPYFGNDHEVLAAAHLHDTIEDTNTSAQDILDGFGTRVCSLVVDLTKVYHKGSHPHLNAAKRAELEADRLSRIQLDAKAIKLADIISNMRSLPPDDPKFCKWFTKKSQLAYASVAGGHGELAAIARDLIWPDCKPKS